MIKANGNGLSECFECKKNGKYSLQWTSFLFRTEVDNYTHLYCYECCSKIENTLKGGIFFEQNNN